MKLCKFLIYIFCILYFKSLHAFSDPLVSAAEACDGELTKKTLHLGYSVNSQDLFNVTALMRAAHSGCVPVAEILIASGASLEMADDGGATALHLAAKAGHTEIIEKLLAASAPIDIADDEGFTPLMRAIESCNIDAINAVIKHHPDFALKNQWDENALLIAAKYNDLTIFSKILSYYDLTNTEYIVLKSILKNKENMLKILINNNKYLKYSENVPNDMNANETRIVSNSSESLDSLEKMIKDNSNSIKDMVQKYSVYDNEETLVFEDEMNQILPQIKAASTLFAAKIQVTNNDSPVEVATGGGDGGNGAAVQSMSPPEVILKE